MAVYRSEKRTAALSTSFAVSESCCLRLVFPLQALFRRFLCFETIS